MMHPATTRLLGRPGIPQRTPEWYAARRGLLTASDAAAALDVPPYASYRGSARADALRKKLANEPLCNVFVAHGTKYEDEARALAAAAMGEVVHDVGLVAHATEPWLAASPDGVTSSGRLVEIKCPLKRAIQPGVVPEHYVPQIQVQMEVCDVDATIFVQYKPPALGFQLDIVVVERDRAWFAANRDALKAFHDDLVAGIATYVPAPPPAPPACRVADDLYAPGPPQSV